MANTAQLAKLPGFFTVTATQQDTMVAGRKRSLQAERRASEVWTDQHGREWAAERDLKSGHPCTPLVPLGWRAPILPPPQFIRFGSARGRPVITIDYVAWKEYAGIVQAEYEEEVRYHAVRMFPNSWAREIDQQNPLIMQEAGRPPYAVDFVTACEAGSRWALGLSQQKPKWLTDELESTLPKAKRLSPADARTTVFDDADAPEDESGEIADRLARAARFAELDDENEPERAPVPVRRGPGRPRKRED